MFGFLVINKPAGITSRKAINQVAQCVRPAKVGHAGTLDPLATGVLVACIGPATRLTPYVQKLPKKYSASFRLGLQSSTEDIEGDLTWLPDAPSIDEAQLTKTLPLFLGTIMQTPPKFSALRVGGKRAYELARRGVEVDLKPRPVTIERLTLTKFAYPDFHLDIVCGSGTYVRSLGRDIGKRLGSNAIMTALTRTAIGSFELAEALELEKIDPEVCQSNIRPATLALPELIKVRVSKQQVTGFANGVPLRLDDATASNSDEMIAIDEHDRLIAVLRRKQAGLFAPSINFSHYWLMVDQSSD